MEENKELNDVIKLLKDEHKHQEHEISGWCDRNLINNTISVVKKLNLASVIVPNDSEGTLSYQTSKNRVMTEDEINDAWKKSRGKV